MLGVLKKIVALAVCVGAGTLLGHRAGKFKGVGMGMPAEEWVNECIDEESVSDESEDANVASVILSSLPPSVLVTGHYDTLLFIYLFLSVFTPDPYFIIYVNLHSIS